MKTSAMKNAVLALLGTTMMVPAVAAQEGSDTQITSVYERSRPDFDAAGIRTGSFLFYPTIDLDGKYDSNIFASDEANTPDVSDFVAIVKPSFALTSDWNRNFFSITAGADIGRYIDEGSEDFEDYNVGASGRVDMSHGSSISMDLSYADKHEDRGSPDSVGTQESPTKYSELAASVGYQRDEGMFSLALDGDYIKKDYDDAPLIGGGVLENDDRDREEYTGSARVGYHLNEDYEAFVKFTTVAVEYDTRDGVLRDSDGWDVVGGAAFNVGGATEGEVYVGYVKRDFDSASLEDISDFKFGASLLWNATGLTSVQVAVDRTVVETTTPAENAAGATVFASGILSTLYSVRVEHELQRNLLLEASVSYNEMDFVNTLRNDDLTNAGVGVKYLMNRNLSLGLNYDFGKRSSNTDTFTPVQNSDYDRHAVIASITAQW